MRVLSISGFASVLLVAGLAVGCDDSTGAGGAGGKNTTASGTSSSTGMSNPCDPKASCPAVDKTCIGLVDNAGESKFGLRMSSLALTKPASLTTGVVASVFQGGVTPSIQACSLPGPGLFSWLLQFDTAAGTLKTGGAKPVQDPATGYAFVDEQMGGLQIAPVVLQTKPDASGKFGAPTGADLVMPVYLDQAGTQAVLLPLRNARIDMGTLSASQNCIGTYNAAGLDPVDMCFPNDVTSAFISGGSLAGFMSLEDADGVVIDQLKRSLCVLLTGDPATYGEMDMAGITKCKRTAGVINFKGDWCAATDMAATATCADSVDFRANFSASSVLVTN